jgi:hypothetical protein
VSHFHKPTSRMNPCFYLETRTNTTNRRRSRWHRSSTTRGSLVTASSTSGSSHMWLHASLCTTSSDVAAVWTRSKATAPPCPSSSRGPHDRLQRRRHFGLFWAPHLMKAPSHRPAHRPPEAQPAT